MKGRIAFVVVGIVLAVIGLFLNNPWLTLIGGGFIGFFFFYLFED